MEGVIYAYTGGKSEAQQQYTARRLAQITSQRRQRRDSELASREIWRADDPQSLFLSSPPLSPTLPTSPSAPRSGIYHHHHRFSSLKDVPVVTAFASSPSSAMMSTLTEDQTHHTNMDMTNSSSHSELNHQNLLNQPFELRYGRRYLREVSYPLPCDLAEIQRQNLRTLLAYQVFGCAVCSPNIKHNVPQRVLEIGCGGGYWSALCHDYFSSLGFPNVSFTGIDLAPLAPDYRKQGMNWTFVQHDLRRMPLPFNDGEFDLIMSKDVSLAIPHNSAYQLVVDEFIRVLREGGTYEIWESDHVIRSLLPHPPSPGATSLSDQNVADATATYLIGPGTPFAPAHNKYIRQASGWLDNAFSKRRLSSTPCARISQLMLNETSLAENGWRRIAIPLSEMWWEREEHLADSPVSHYRGKDPQAQNRLPLTADQTALRQTALVTFLQQIESMEPMLKEASGKSSEGWAQWKASMMANVMNPDQGKSKLALSGEALEIGAWYAVKRSHGK